MSDQTNQTKIFANGIYFKEKSENAPDWVVGGLSMKAEDAIQFINEHKNDEGWIKMNIKRSQGGKTYVELDTWKPTPRNNDTTSNAGPIDNATTVEPSENTDDDGLPF